MRRKREYGVPALRQKRKERREKGKKEGKQESDEGERKE